MFGYLWLPCMATFATIALSAILFKEFLKKKRACQIAVDGIADSDSAPRNGPVESAARTCTSPPVNETATSSGHDWEVFLSFRGKDTRAGFTDFLYTSLNSAGIRAFKDDEELRVGEEFAPELLQAIKQSKIFIPIFSKGYASSVWCLKELAQMAQCQKTGGQKIMPIFYDVAPSELRHKTGCYGDAFRSHEKKKRYDKKTMQEWKDALSVVGDINGWDLHSQEENRREGEFARKLTQKVFKELKKAHLAESDCLVNVDNHVDVIMEMIGAGTNETRIVGIHGMGGIGKTTIAKIIYNKLADNFENHCFLRDIRETSKSKGIPCLQNQLISDILKGNCVDIKDIDEGIQTIKERLSNKKVLLLLDDVEEKKHINALVGKRDWLGKGSKIIITTRKKSICEVPEVDCDYELSGLDSKQSLQLFSKHAFRRDSPLDEYINQSNRAIRIAGGLSLTLEVIGSLLCGTKNENWDLKLKKLENIPDEKVWSKLKISYDGLDVGQQHIFLDIACLFIGYDKDIVVHFWDESKFPEEALEVLQNISLIKIEENNELWMHDQLRDLGREIVREESKRKIEKQSRAWDPREGLNLLRKHEGKKEVEALRVKLDHHQECHFTYAGFEDLSHLRFLELDDGVESFYVEGRWQSRRGLFNVEGRLLWRELGSDAPPTYENSDLLPQLRWLSCRNILPTFNITNFSMEDVVFLDLSNSEITDDWKGWSHMKVMRNLKVLNLNSCMQLQRLPDALGRDLSNLERLSLQNCKSLKRLPDSIGNLKSLIELDISHTDIKGLPDSIGNLKNLKVMQTWFSRIRKIPDALWTLGKLEDIQIVRYDGWTARVFHVHVGECISVNQSLRILELTGAKIYALPRLPESLIKLSLSRLLMDTFPDLSNLANLKELHLGFRYRYSHGLVEYPMPQWIGNLRKLESLRLRDCYFVTTSPRDLSLPPQLKSLYLYFCPNLRRLPTLPSSLSSLSLEDCESLCSMEDLSNLKKLSYLLIWGVAITEIQGLGCLENLGYLFLRFLRHVKVLPDLSNLNKLTSLDVSYCDNLVEIQGELPESLEKLDISSCKSLWKLPDLSSLMRLQEVCVNTCVSLVEIQGELPQSLRILQLRNAGIHALPTLPESLIELYLEKLYMDTFPNLSSLTNLKKLDLVFGSWDSDAESGGPVGEHQIPQWIGNLTKLESLRLGYHFVITFPSYLSFLPQLKELDLECPNLCCLPTRPSILTSLCLKYCNSLCSMEDLSNLKNLSSLKICFSGITEIQGLGYLENLQDLWLVELEHVKILPDLSNLSKLSSLQLSCCGNLVEIQGEQLPQSLDIFKITRCRSLEKLPDLSSLMGKREVEIVKCSKLNVEAILGYARKNSQDLQIIGFPQLRILPDLRDLRNSNELTSLQVDGCYNLVEIQGELPECLEELYICWSSLRKLPNLSRLMGL